MSTKLNLAELAESAGSTIKKPTPPEPVQTRAKPAPKRPDKAGEGVQEKLVPVSGLFPKEVRDQFKIMGIKNNKTVQEQLGEAINDCFAKYGLPEIAPSKNGK